MKISRARRGRCRGRTRGAAAVELGLILPLLVTLVLGCVDFGRFAYTYIAVSNASRAGAAFAMVHPVTPNTTTLWQNLVKAAIVDEMTKEMDSTKAPFDPSKISVPAPTVTTDTTTGLKTVTVTVSYPFSTLVPWPTVPKSVTLERTVEVRVIR
jgi:Flp pilus assembly protein TadG